MDLKTEQLGDHTICRASVAWGEEAWRVDGKGHWGHSRGSKGLWFSVPESLVPLDVQAAVKRLRQAEEAS